MLPNKAAMLTMEFWTRAGTACGTKLSGHSCCLGKSAALYFSRLLLWCGVKTSTNGIQPRRALCSGRRLHLTTAELDLSVGNGLHQHYGWLLPDLLTAVPSATRAALALAATPCISSYTVVAHKLVEFTLSRALKFDSCTLELAREMQTRKSQALVFYFVKWSLACCSAMSCRL